MTKTEIYSALKELVSASSLSSELKDEYLDRLDKDIEMASHKGASTPKVNSAKDKLMVDIKDVLSKSSGAMTIPDIISALGSNYKYGNDENAKALNSQILSASLSALGTDRGTGEVEKTMIKKVAYFSLVE